MQHTTEVLNEPFKDIPYEDMLVVRKVLIKALNEIDPDLNTYMTGSLEWTNPFYSYLGFIPPLDDKRTKLNPSKRVDLSLKQKKS